MYNHEAPIIAVPADLLNEAAGIVYQHKGADHPVFRGLFKLLDGVPGATRIVPANPEPRFTQRSGTWQPVPANIDCDCGAEPYKDGSACRENHLSDCPANPELDEAMYGAIGGDAPAVREPLYDKLVAPQGRKQVTIFVPERGIDGKTIRPLVVEKELNQVFGWYLATHGVRGSADSAKTPVIAFTVAIADDLGVRDAIGIAGRAAALTGAPVTVTLDTGDMVKVDAMGRFV